MMIMLVCTLQKDHLDWLKTVGHYYPILKQPPDAFYKKAVLKSFAMFIEKHLCWPSALQLYQKETPTQVFSCEYYKIFNLDQEKLAHSSLDVLK